MTPISLIVARILTRAIVARLRAWLEARANGGTS